MRVLVTLLLVPSGFFAFFSAFGLLISFLNGSEQLRNEAFLALLISGTISLILYGIADSKSTAEKPAIEKTPPPKKTAEIPVRELTPPPHKNAHYISPEILPHETKIAGVTYKNKDQTSRQSILERTIVQSKLILSPEPDNVHDKNAIKVLSEHGCLGYIPIEFAAKLKGENISNLNAILIQKGQLVSGIYWAKIRISRNADKAIPFTSTCANESQNPLEPPLPSEAPNAYNHRNLIDAYIPLDYQDNSPIPGNELNGNVRLTREYLPPEHYLQKNLFPRIESDDALKVNELTEAITEYYSEKIRSLANLKEHPIQEMTSEMLASWQRDMQNYSDALKLFSGDTSLKKIQESKLYYDINLCKISDFINELENINKYTVIENISGYATNGLFNGEVEITSSNSKSYFKGLYSNGLKNGCGIEISPNGDIYEGEFVNGYKCGRGRLIKADEILAGIFINGKYRADTIFNDFKGPEFWIGYNDELGKVIFAPRDGPNGPGCRFMLVTTPDNWDVIQIEASRLGNPIRKHMEALTDEAKGQLEKQLELWKIEFREYGFIKIYSKLLPYHLTEEIEMEEYQLYIVNYKIELTSAKEFLKATKDERVSIISDLLEGYEYDPFDSYW